MSKLVIHTNKHFKTEEDLLVSIAKSTVASSKLEGIKISFEEAYQMALQAAEKIKKEKGINDLFE